MRLLCTVSRYYAFLRDIARYYAYILSEFPHRILLMQGSSIATTSRLSNPTSILFFFLNLVQIPGLMCSWVLELVPLQEPLKSLGRTVEGSEKFPSRNSLKNPRGTLFIKKVHVWDEWRVMPVWLFWSLHPDLIGKCVLHNKNACFWKEIFCISPPLSPHPLLSQSSSFIQRLLQRRQSIVCFTTPDINLLAQHNCNLFVVLRICYVCSHVRSWVM